VRKYERNLEIHHFLMDCWSPPAHAKELRDANSDEAYFWDYFLPKFPQDWLDFLNSNLLSAVRATRADQLAALAWLRTQSFVSRDSIAVAGNSFGGIDKRSAVEVAIRALDEGGGLASVWTRSNPLSFVS
jgi:hypothetical protein